MINSQKYHHTIYGDIFMNQSYWQKTLNPIGYPSLKEDIEVDVCIIGGGLSGISTAYHLNNSSLKTIVLEKDTFGAHTSSHTTAKITVLHGLLYNTIVQNYGNYEAYMYYKSNQDAFSRIKKHIDDHHIACDYIINNAYIYSDDLLKQQEIKKQTQLLKHFKVPVIESNNSLGLPLQATFHPLKYLYGLMNASDNIDYYEQSKVTSIKRTQNTFIVYVNQCKVKCRYLVHATRYPIIYKGLFFTKMYQSKEYAYYTKDYKDHHSYLNLDNNHSYRSLNKGSIRIDGKNKEWYALDSVTYRGIPYISEFNHHEYIIYGFNKWGMTLSEVAGQLISDMILKKHNPYISLYSKEDELITLYKEHYKKILIPLYKGYIYNRQHIKTIDKINKNDGGIIKEGLKLKAVYKDEKGHCHYMSPYCPHMLGIIQFNKETMTWTCPCHQSTFDKYGQLLEGPSLKCLKEQK